MLSEQSHSFLCMTLPDSLTRQTFVPERKKKEKNAREMRSHVRRKIRWSWSYLYIALSPAWSRYVAVERLYPVTPQRVMTPVSLTADVFLRVGTFITITDLFHELFFHQAHIFCVSTHDGILLAHSDDLCSVMSFSGSWVQMQHIKSLYIHGQRGEVLLRFSFDSYSLLLCSWLLAE